VKSCRKCAVKVAGSHEKCPLCQNTLVGEAQSDPGPFPYVPLISHKHGLLFRVLLLCSVVAVIVSVTVNLMFPRKVFWSLFVAAGVACLWLSLAIAVRKRRNILKNMAYQLTAASILSVFWDLFTGWHGWSVDFFIPISFLAVMSATAVLARVLKMKTGAYMIYSILLVLYGIIPSIFILTGLNTVIYPSLICVAGSLISLAALLIFEGRNMAEELKRRLHM